MAENQEQIESRLCGYVDETLDPAEKAEVEAHLQSHPQHRQLLAELRQMRVALRALPRASAPMEMSESFTGQLERSVLLDGIGDRPIEPRMRISRLPQLAAIAAIVVLAVGLGFVVLYAWPGLKSGPQVAQNTPHGPVVVPNIDGAQVIQPKPVPAPVAPAAGPSNPPQVAEASPPGEPVFPPAHAMNAGGVTKNVMPEGNGNSPAAAVNPELEAVASSALANHSVQALLGRTEEADRGGGKADGRPTLVMVVATADADATIRRLGNYLQTSNADWQSTSAFDGAQKSARATFGNAANTPVAGSLGAALKPSAPGASSGGELEQKTNPTTMPQATQPDLFANAGAAEANAPTTGPFGMNQQSQLATNGAKDDYRLMKAPLKDELQNQIDDTNDRLYVVRNLSFQQAQKLSDELQQGAKPATASLLADKSDDGTFDAKSLQAEQEMRQSAAPADDMAAPTTSPATRSQDAQLQQNVVEQRDIYMARAAMPTTKPAAPMAAAVAPLDKQSLLGSSPVDLVIVIQNAPPAPAATAAPTTSPTIVPTTAPSTAPATESKE